MNSGKTVPKNEPARHWINGEWVSSSTVANSINPSSGEVLGQYSSGGRAEATAAIAAARRAFDTGTWAHDPQIRMRALLEIADRLDERAEAIGLMLSREMGKVLRDATLEATWSPATLRYNAGTALSQTGTSAEIAPGVFASAMREPIGVAGIIVPWNSPLALLVRALGPALAAGCTTVVNLPGQTALVNALIMEAVAATKSLPDGVVNIFTESGNEGAPLMVASPGVDAINYTGSTKVGRQVAEQGAQTLKRVSLELGGKTPLVVFEDADIETVAPLVVTALTKFNGEFCMTGSRVLVQRSVADPWRKRIATLLEKIVVGRAYDPKSEMGPLIDRANVARIDRFVEDAKRYARIIVRGGPIVDGALAAGAFYRPSLLETEGLDVPLIQEEIFGPVLSFETFATEEEAITRANATVFGLAAAIFTKDLDRAQRVARAVKAGTVWTNTWAVLHDAFEEGGFKHSGIGRARGLRAMEEFQEVKTQFSGDRVRADEQLLHLSLHGTHRRRLMPVPRLPTLGTPPAPAPLRKIALEEHFGHPSVFMRDSDGRYETRKEAEVGHLGPEYFAMVQERLLDFDTTRLQAMDDAGVDKVLLSFGAGFRTFGVQGILDRTEAQNMARTVNDFLAEQVREHPGRYVGMATLALQDPAQAVRELERCITKLGFKGVMINGYTQLDSPDNLIYLDDERLTPFWEALTALDVPLYLHPRASYKAAMYDNHPELTGANWGFAPETATHALRIVYSGIFDRFPTAKLVLGHLGESLPFLAWRIQHGVNFSPNGRFTKKRLVDYLAENIWVTTSGNFNTQALHCTILTMGADRILFSNDYPYEDYAEGGEFIDTVPIAESDRRKIAYANAKTLYKL